MGLHIFRCETCDYHIDTDDTITPHICPKCKTRMYWDFTNANVALDGDTPGFYSPDLGMQIDSPAHLKRVLRKRKMVTLTDSKQKRDYDTEMLDRARSGEFDKCNRNR